jgi:hypothetical protein
MFAGVWRDCRASLSAHLLPSGSLPSSRPSPAKGGRGIDLRWLRRGTPKNGASRIDWRAWGATKPSANATPHPNDSPKGLPWASPP